LRHAFVKLLTMRACPGTLLWTPAVMTSQVWLALPSQATTLTGVKFSRKSPDEGSTERHWPVEVVIVVLVNARVAVVSKTWA